MVNSGIYFSHLRELVALELREEQQSYQRSLEAKGASLTGCIQEPACRYPVHLGNNAYNPLGQLTLELRYEVGEDEVELDFEPGKPATVFYLTDGGAKELPHQCYVELVGDGVMTVSLPSKSALQSIKDLAEHHLLGVQLGIDNTSYRVMQEALSEAERKEDEKFVHLRNILIGNTQPSFRQLPPLSFPWLNATQNAAIQKVVEAQEVSIVHGPPGTGKTTTLVEAIIETLERETQVLVCAPSNAAVDWISEQLMRRSVNVLRIGNPLRMSDEMLDCSYERRYSAHPDYHELWNIKKELRGDKGEVKGDRRHKLQSRAMELEIKINADLFDQARVVSCTLIGSAYRLMERRRFSTLFIDEAAQALEPACWAAILKADRVIMSGDHQQLPPTVKSIKAVKEGLANTLMQKLVGLHPRCVTLLTTQYRMNEDIMAFSSRWFYHNRLQAAPEAAHRLVSPLDTPLTWIDTSAYSDHSEKRTHTGSLTNAQEARLVIHTLRDYIEMISPQKIENERVDFGIITPYRGQARLIRRLLKMQHYFRKLKRHITVGTVDGFQGQERDVIVISLVRDNTDGNIGFLRDLRRMNVAMTRARMKLIIIGNVQALSRHRFYRELAEHIRQHGEFIEIPSDPPQTPQTS